MTYRLVDIVGVKNRGIDRKTVRHVEGAVVVVHINASNVDQVAGLDTVDEIIEEQCVFRTGKTTGWHTAGGFLKLDSLIVAVKCLHTKRSSNGLMLMRSALEGKRNYADYVTV